jgi:hypothetical protein
MPSYIYADGVHSFQLLWLVVAFSKDGAAVAIVERDRPWVTRWMVEVQWWPPGIVVS